MAEKTKNPRLDNPIVRIVQGYKNEAKDAKLNRMNQNRENFECYNLRQDFSHKREGQSQEFLAKQQGAVEQITSFLQQGLMDQGDWYSVEEEPGVKNPAILGEEIRKLLSRQLDKCKYDSHVADSIKSGALGSLMVTKIHGTRVTSSKYKTETKWNFLAKNRKKLIRVDKSVWQLRLSLVRQEDWYPDPTGNGLYEIQHIDMDYHELLKMARENPDDFDIEAVKECGKDTEDLTQKHNKSRETDQNVAQSTRKRIGIDEMWGTIVDPQTGEVLHENVVCAITDDGFIIRPPTTNPWWHGKSPFVVTPIIRVPHSVWHRALMDAPTKHNLALNEIYNLQLDSGLMSVWGIKQVREDWLDDPSQIADGIAPGVSLLLNSTAPAGAKAVERVDTGTMSREGTEMFQVTDREFQQSALTNDTRLGSLPQRAVKATEIVASNQSITGVFNGIVKIIEKEHIAATLEKAWMAMAQNMDDLDLDEVKALLGEERAILLSQMAPEDRFAATAQGQKFKVYGLSTTLNKINDFRKHTSLLQTIGTSDALVAAFQRKYSFTKLLGEIVKSLDIKAEKIEMDDEEKAQIQKEQEMAAKMAMMQAAASGKGGQNPQSQIPQMATSSEETGAGLDVPMSTINSGITEPG